MAKLNVMKAINDNRGKLNTNYSIGINDMEEIISNSKDYYSSLYNFFVIGYVQGKKAAKAEIRKAGLN